MILINEGKIAIWRENKTFIWFALLSSWKYQVNCFSLSTVFNDPLLKIN
jgi:hypothetical protein